MGQPSLVNQAWPGTSWRLAKQTVQWGQRSTAPGPDQSHCGMCTHLAWAGGWQPLWPEAEKQQPQQEEADHFLEAQDLPWGLPRPGSVWCLQEGSRLEEEPPLQPGGHWQGQAARCRGSTSALGQVLEQL